MRAARLFPLIAAPVAVFPAASACLPPRRKKQEKEAAFDESALGEKILRAAKLSVEGPALLKYFRDRTYKEADAKRLALLVRQLGDKEFKVREQAFADLLALGATALAVLKEALNSPDEEVAKRAAELRARIEERANPAVQAATARLIGHRQPEG